MSGCLQKAANARRALLGWSRAGLPACVRLAAASLQLVIAGCTQVAVNPLAPPVPPVVWPKPPDIARVQYLGRLTGSPDVSPKKSFQESLDELIYGPKPPSVFVTPQTVAVHGGGSRVAVADTNGLCVHLLDLEAHRYERIASAGQPLTDSRGSVKGQSPRAFECPVAVAWAGDVLWVADAKLHAVAILEDGKSRWVGENVLKRPAGLAYCTENGLCYVSDAAAHAILAFDPRGAVVLQFGTRGAAPGQFNCPSHLACGPGPTLAVADSLNFRVQRLGVDGSVLGTFGKKGDAAGDFALPKGVAFDPQGHIWVVDAQFENVQAFTPEGQLLLAVGGEGRGVGQFSLPAGICIDVRGRIWIADTYNRRVQVFELLP